MMDEWSFKDEIQAKKINLARAALHFARHIAYPSLDVPACLTQIDELAQLANKSIRQADPIQVKAEMLSEFLFQRSGYKGNAEAYYDVRNSFMNEVLTRRVGIPISLSVLFMIVAKRLDLPAYGIGMPGHFIVMVPNGNQRLFFDPFNGGGRLTFIDCARLVTQTTGYAGSFRPEWLDPVDERVILTRMLNNLKGGFVQSENWAKAIKTVECLQLLNPDDASFLRDIGVLYYQNGDMYQALHFLNAYAEKDPKASDIPFIRNGLSDKLDGWVKLN